VFFFIFERFVYIYIYCKTFNAEFNKLIKTVGHLARFIEKNEVEDTRRCQQFWRYLDIFIFLSSP